MVTENITPEHVNDSPLRKKVSKKVKAGIICAGIALVVCIAAGTVYVLHRHEMTAGHTDTSDKGGEDTVVKPTPREEADSELINHASDEDTEQSDRTLAAAQKFAKNDEERAEVYMERAVYRYRSESATQQMKELAL